jgi:hypothetical protein
MAETIRTLESKLGWPATLTSYLQSELLAHFGDAWVTGHGPLVSRMTNDEKDRHVLAAAVACGASATHQDPTVVTAKLRTQAADWRRTLPELLKILGKTVPEFVALISSLSPPSLPS